MSDFRDRLVQEYTELEDKLGKLMEFINTPAFNSLSAMNRHLLDKQSDVMASYLFILKRRLLITK